MGSSGVKREKAITAPALNGLKFISSSDGMAEWPAMEKRFKDITASGDGRLHRSLFGQCIGMVENGNAREGKNSEDFALKLFDALSRRLCIKGDSITIGELREFWEHISDQSFDSRLQTFLDMVDKNGDGRIKEEEVREIITLSASANNLSNIQKQAREYAALIMEELDPHNQGYIMIDYFEMLLLKAQTGAKMPTVKEKGDKSEKETDKLLKGLYEGTRCFTRNNWQRVWMYLAVPMTLYAREGITRALRSTIKAVKITKVESHHGKVLALFMTRPPGFSYKSGQYMFVKCDAVSSFQWHPFYITSAPGEDSLSVHIQEQGDWTRELRELFEKVLRPTSSGEKGARSSRAADNVILPRVMIDGPYGAPAQEYMEYEVVLLVGLGIGITPMISIIKDIVNNTKVREQAKDYIEKRNGADNVKQKKKDKFKTKKAYLYWMTGEHETFSWFKNIMNEIAEQDLNHVVELHNYCTSIYEKGDARSALITMIQSLNHAKNGVDVVSGTRVISHFAWPSWRDVYDRIATENTGMRVGVFYCGSPNLAQELSLLALEFSRDTTTRFYFHT